MNRTIGIVIVLLVVLGLGIYINAQRKDSEQWQDGTYIGRSAVEERGYYGEIELVIADGKIRRAEYEEKDRQGVPKGPDYPYQAGPGSHPKYEERLIETQDPSKVDAITGATETHERFLQAVEEALRKAKEGDRSLPPEPEFPRDTAPPGEDSDRAGQAKEWKDGTYSAQGERDEYGYRGEIEIVISGGKIIGVQYDEVDQEGNPKGEDYPYPEGPESEDEYEKRLLETGDPEQVDVISGATDTWERFQETAKEALKKAE